MTMRNAERWSMPVTRAELVSRVYLTDPKLSQISNFAAAILLGATLSGCATIDGVLSQTPHPIAKPPLPVAQPVVPRAQTPVAQVVPVKQKPKPTPRDTKEPEQVAAIDPDSLIGLDPPAVEKLLGAPANIGKGDPSLVWTYAGIGCSFQIIFYPDIKTTSFHALKLMDVSGNDAKTQDLRACLRNILTARNNGPS